MGRRWVRDRPLVVAGVVLIAVAVALAVWLYVLPSGQREAELKYVEFVLGLVGLVITVLGLLRDVRRPVEPRPLDILVDLLAQAVSEQWRAAADERRLVSPAPIPIRWSLSTSDIAGPVVAAVGPPDQLPAFPPLPGHTTITEEQLGAGGGRRELHQLFAGLGSGRIVVVGAPGSGKSGAAILLLLDALTHRDGLNDAERAHVPVPVLFTGHGWDPNTTSARDWVRDQLVATYPLFQRRGGDADAAALTAAPDKIAFILDGLDEMDEALRPAALLALSDVPFRVVVLTRSAEMIQATRHTWLISAVAIQLHDVSGPQAADYLERAGTGPPPSDWQELLSRLREHPNSLLAYGLSKPLAITLVRDTYHAGDDLDELLDDKLRDEFRDSTDEHAEHAEHIERYLIARVLPAAYTLRPGRPPPPCGEAQARQALTFLAQRMNQDNTRDLAWWHIPRWASTMPGIFTTCLKYGLKRGLLYGLAVGLAFGLVVGFLAGGRTVASMVIGIVLGLLIGAIYGAMLLTMGISAGKRASWRLMRRFKVTVEPRRTKIIVNGRALASRQALELGLYSALSGELIIGLWHGIASVLVSGPVFGLMTWLGYGLTEGDTGEGRPLSPREIWRNDRAAGLLMGLLSGLGLGLIFGFVYGLVYALTWGLTFGLVVGFSTPRSRSTAMAWWELKIVGYVPAVKIMSFLEDARERGVLRTVGSVYQFRHAILQDQLAGQITTSPSTSLTPQ